MSRKQRFSVVKEKRRQKIPSYKRYNQTTTFKTIVGGTLPLPEKEIKLSTGLSGLREDTQRAIRNYFFASAIFMVGNFFFAEYILYSAAELLGYKFPLVELFAFALLCLTRGKGLLFGALITLLINWIFT